MVLRDCRSHQQDQTAKVHNACRHADCQEGGYLDRASPVCCRAGGRHAGSRGRQEQHQEGSLGDHKVLLETHAVLGLCQLLEHHVAVVEQAQQAVNPLLQPQELSAEGEASLLKLPVHCELLHAMSKVWAVLLQQDACLHLTSNAAAHLEAVSSFGSPDATCQECTLTKCAPAEEAVATALSSMQLLISLGARQVLANSAAACAAEMGSMRSTLHVLAAHLEALQGCPVQLPVPGEVQVLGSLSFICITCACTCHTRAQHLHVPRQ